MTDEEPAEVQTGERGLRKERGGTNGDFDYCNGSVPCNSGEGDCDSNLECTPGLGLVCGHDNGPNFSMPEGWDVCVPAHCTNHIADGDEDPGRIDCGGSCGACVCGGTPGSATFCTPACPCAQGQGDCDRNADCQSGLVCRPNNGASFGLPANFDVCVPAPSLPDAGTAPSDASAPADAAVNADATVDAGAPGSDSGIGDAGTFTGSPTIERVSLDSNGAQGDGTSFTNAVSGDGRWVVYMSTSTNLVANDTNGVEDIFLRDRQFETTTRVSVTSAGAQADGPSEVPAISADGHVVAFSSLATNLVPGDTNGESDVFVHDLQTGIISRVSVASDGTQGNALSRFPVLSEDGRFVAFFSEATNLVPGDTTGSPLADAFVHDRQTGETTRVNVSTAGVEANGDTRRICISADGRYVVFTSNASNLVAGDTNGENDVFVRDRQLGTTTRISLDSAGAQANGESASWQGAMSQDGRFVVFLSSATNLVPGDMNGVDDIFVRDLQLGITTRVSVTAMGQEANDRSGAVPAISGDGRFVVFESRATNLVANDTNAAVDIFVYDRQTGQIARASVSSTGVQANGDVLNGNISRDGRFVVFESGASNLVPNDTSFADVFATPNPL